MAEELARLVVLGIIKLEDISDQKVVEKVKEILKI